jgi:hypothetical protein
MKKSLSKQISTKLKRLKKTLAACLSLLIFFFAFYYAFFSQNITETDVPNYADLKVDSFQDYNNSISNTRNGIKNLIDSKQLEQINYYKDIFKDVTLEKSQNPFVKFF